jgi:curved DNA-binding protein CbpA
MPGEQGKPTTAIPKPVAGLDLRSLPIGPAEAYVLSRVDGRSSEAEIALATGLPAADVAAALQRLAGLGAVNLGTPVAPPRSGTSHPMPGPGGGSGLRSRPTPRILDATAEGDEALPAEALNEDVGIDLDRRKVILRAHARVEGLSHYSLLGVPETAEKKEIKRAYYDLVAVFHPDKYFGKQLGSYKSKLERIFRCMTDAHDTLVKQERRDEYDAFLQSQRATQGLDEPDSSRTLELIREEMEREARLAEERERQTSERRLEVPRYDPAGAAPAVRPSPPPAANAGSLPPVSVQAVRALTADERRRALAKKLGASVAPPRHDEPSAQPVTNVRDSARDALKRRYETKLKEVETERVARYIAQADEAMKNKKLVAAANALRIAVSLAPDDAPLSERYQKVEREASAAMAEQYLEQARYEAGRGQYTEAAQAFERALRGRPTAQIYERTAFCLVEARGDTRKSVEYARKAVELSPNEASYRITLGRAYGRAGMEQSALGEFERARTLAPTDDTIKDWVKRAKRGEI